MTDDYTKAVKALLTQYGFDPAGDYLFTPPFWTLKHVERECQLMARDIAAYDAAITPERKAVIDAHIRAWKEMVAGMELEQPQH